MRLGSSNGWHGKTHVTTAWHAAGTPWPCWNRVQGAQALAELSDAEKVLGAQRMPPEVYLYRARGLAAAGNFAGADEALTQAGGRMMIPAETLTEINLRRMAAAVEREPNKADPPPLLRAKSSIPRAATRRR